MPFDPCQVYSPEADTFLLARAARAEVKAGDRILEVGTGSGYIAAELVQICDVVATDINPHAALCARERGVDVLRGDLFSGIRGTFDLILFNPPYLPTKPYERVGGTGLFDLATDGGCDGIV